MLYNSVCNHSRYKEEICKRSDQPKIERLEINARRDYNIESLTGQRHDGVQTEGRHDGVQTEGRHDRVQTADGCFELVGSRRHGVASNEEETKSG